LTLQCAAAQVPGNILESVEAIHGNNTIQQAFDSIEAMNDINVQRLIEITETPAPPFAESIRAADLLQRLQAAGLSEVYIDEVGNVIGRRPGQNRTKTVAFVAHIDTVFPAETEIKVRREGERYYAPGIGDNTRGIVAMLCLIEVMEKHGIRTRDDILFVGSVGEEGLGDLRGVRHLFSEDGVEIDSFIAMDGGNSERLVVDAVGSNRYRVEFHGPGGHSYGAFGRAHPHQALADALSRFTSNATALTTSGEKATFSVGRIGGGTSINSIPFSSWMEVDMRSVDPHKVAALDTTLREAIQFALDKENERRTEGAALTVRIEPVGARPAGLSNRESVLVQNATAALRQLGVEPKLVASSTDSNIPISLGIPAVTISRGGVSRDAHAPAESWENVDAHLAIQSALLLLAAEAGFIDEQ
jgi:acetylornithine deacetylase/succinyl-diaminopimelate desuccinylase-like protein